MAALAAVVQLSPGPHEVTLGTAVVGTALFVGAIALPALLFAKWDEVEA